MASQHHPSIRNRDDPVTYSKWIIDVLNLQICFADGRNCTFAEFGGGVALVYQVFDVVVYLGFVVV